MDLFKLYRELPGTQLTEQPPSSPSLCSYNLSLKLTECLQFEKSWTEQKKKKKFSWTVWEMVIIPIIRHKIRHTLDRLPVYHRADTLTVKTNIQHSNLSGARGARGNHTNTQTVHREASAGQQVQTWYLLPERLNHHASSPYSKRNYSKSEHHLEHVFIPIRCWFSVIEQRLWMWSFFKTDWWSLQY